MEADLMVGWVPYLSQFECNKIISHSLSPGTLIGKRNTSDQDWRLFFFIIINCVVIVLKSHLKYKKEQVASSQQRNQV